MSDDKKISIKTDSGDFEDSRVEGTPYQGLSSGNLNRDLNYEAISKFTSLSSKELNVKELIASFIEECNADVMKIEELKQASWNESKVINSKSGNDQKININGRTSSNIKELILEFRNQVHHFTLGAEDVGIDSFFDIDGDIRFQKQIAMALAANKNRVKKYLLEKQEEAAATLINEYNQIKEIMSALDKGDMDKTIAVPLLKDKETIKWMITAVNRSNDKLAIIITSRFKLAEMNQMVGQMYNKNVNDLKENTWDYLLGIKSNAAQAIKLIVNSAERPCYPSYQKLMRKLHDWKLNYATMGEKGNIEGQLSELKTMVYDIQDMYAELDALPQYEGLLEKPKLFAQMVQKVGMIENPSKSHVNYTKNQAKWERLVENATTKYLKTNDEPMLLSERIRYFEDQIKTMVNSGDFKSKKIDNKPNNVTNKQKDIFALNINQRSNVKYCSNVLRQGYCNREGCKFKAISKAQHAQRPECANPDGCKFGRNCLYAHPNDHFDSSKRCVHRSSANNVNEAAAADDNNE